jgi:hypothetical protein
MPSTATVYTGLSTSWALALIKRGKHTPFYQSRNGNVWNIVVTTQFCAMIIAKQGAVKHRRCAQ